MKLKGRTILITGGTSGIGLELAARLLDMKNEVIVTGRDPAKLARARKALPGLHTYASDVSDPKAIEILYKKVMKDFPALDFLVNNAGQMRKQNFRDDSSDLEDLTREIEVNLMGPIRMTKRFLPHLLKQNDAAVMNVSSGLAYVPLAISPVYSATKAGMHSFSLSLRVQLAGTSVTVVELAPPLTETPLVTEGFTQEEVGGVKGMDVKKMVEITLAGLASGKEEIRPGLSTALHWMGRIAPKFATGQLGKSAQAQKN